MKKSMFLIALVGVISLGLSAQSSSASPDSIVFEKLVHDYGTIAQDSDGYCEFKFTNKGQSPLILSNVSSSCGCTVPNWPKDPILPGAAGTIKVKYDTKRVGNFNKSITVNSNAINSMVLLRITGNVHPKN